jgi:transcriptional regulator with XRE-family HTH domain
MSAASKFGELFKELRVRKKMTLREFCIENGFDAGNISKLERGLLPPPESHEKLATYAKALGLREGSDDWYEFFDQAAVARGHIPATVMGDEELVARLPFVFRTLSGKRVTPDQVDELIKLIKRNELDD